MRNGSSLGAREFEILRSIVRAYIETGEPIGSRTISRLRNDSLSPASIRNVMADLADEGYLTQPHTSAGRVPTAKAFSVFVESLVLRQLPEDQVERLLAELRELDSVQARVTHSTRILSRMTQNLGIVAALPVEREELERIELVGLPDQRVLMIVVMRGGVVRNRVVSVPDTFGPDELQSIRNYVNANFAGWQLGDARTELMRRIEEGRARYDAILGRLTILCRKGLLESEPNPQIHVEGASNLVGLDLHLTREKMRELFRELEEKQRVAELLDRFLEKPHGEVGVHVGLEEAHPSMKELALIGVSVRLPSGLLAKIAVLGPIRMNYSKIMSAVLGIGQAFERVTD